MNEPGLNRRRDSCAPRCSMVLRTALTTNELVTLERNMLLQDANGNYGIRMKLTDHAYRYMKHIKLPIGMPDAGMP